VGLVTGPQLIDDTFTMTIHAENITDRDQWSALLSDLPAAHILQSWEWGDFKQATTGWVPYRYAFRRGGQIVAAASIGVRQVGPFRLMYAPKGPALDYTDGELSKQVIDWLMTYARQERTVWLKIDPDVAQATGEPGSDEDTLYLPGQQLQQLLRQRGWYFSDDQVQFRNTIVIDLRASEDDLLMQMSQNTRRKVRQAEKKEVSLRPATPDDLPVLYQLYAETGQRDGFLIRPYAYYASLWRDFMQRGLAHAIIAEYAGAPIAHVILFRFGQTCWYFYGASSEAERQRMPNYALQWAAMRWAKAQGCIRYDMWGAPNDFSESDPMWGVYQFKRGFRGTVVRHIGAWDYAPYGMLYRAYTRGWPRLRGWLRQRRTASA